MYCLQTLPVTYLDGSEDDVKSAWPLWIGLHTCYNGEVKGKQYGNMEQILNARLSSDCSLQLENMKVESLVIVDQHATVNLYLSLVHTARHIMGAGLAQRVGCVLYAIKHIPSLFGMCWKNMKTFFVCCLMETLCNTHGMNEMGIGALMHCILL